MKVKIMINNEEETEKFGFLLAENIFPGFLLLLDGQLGAGKTRLAKAIGKKIGIETTIKSPTFNIFKIYDEAIIPFYHIDAYRLEGSNQDLGFEEYVESDGFCLIEWYKYIEKILPKNNLKIQIDIIDENKREFTLESFGQEYDDFLERINNVWKQFYI